MRVNSAPPSGKTYTDTGLRNGQIYFYVATVLDSKGNESAYSNQASGMPHYTIGWANLQWPPSMDQTLSASTRTAAAYGQVWIDGVTDQAGAAGGDTTPPAAPANLRVVSNSPTAIALAWDAVSGDPTLYGYEVYRGDASGGPYTLIARVSAAGYTDAEVVEGSAYFYVVRALDDAFNRSGNSNEISATAQVRTVSLTFNVTVPDTTDATGRSVFIAGFLDRLDGGLPQWDPGDVVLTRVDVTHWIIALTGKENTCIEYKYALDDWEHVEKDSACGEIANRTLTLNTGATLRPAGTKTAHPPPPP